MKATCVADHENWQNDLSGKNNATQAFVHYSTKTQAYFEQANRQTEMKCFTARPTGKTMINQCMSLLTASQHILRQQAINQNVNSATTRSGIR